MHPMQRDFAYLQLEEGQQSYSHQTVWPLSVTLQNKTYEYLFHIHQYLEMQGSNSHIVVWLLI